MRRKKQEQDAPAPGDHRLAPADVQQVEFRLAFRGYNERDVDAFLDRLTEDLSSYVEENQRLRAGAGPVLPSPGSQAEADDIVVRARDEASAIVRRAEEDAAAIRAASGSPGHGDARVAMAPFLNREREFLQSLGTLVQGHAEEIKEMVLALRARPGSAATSSGPPPEAEAPPGAPAAEDAAPAATATEEEERDAVVPASAAEIADRLGVPEPAASEAAPDRANEPDEVPVVVESSTEPVFSSEGAPAGDRRERSLRELFWGED